MAFRDQPSAGPLESRPRRPAAEARPGDFFADGGRVQLIVRVDAQADGQVTLTLSNGGQLTTGEGEVLAGGYDGYLQLVGWQEAQLRERQRRTGQLHFAYFSRIRGWH